MDRYRTPMHWVGWGSIALVALACLLNGYVPGLELVLAFALAAAVGLLIRKRALTTLGGLGALALTAAIAYGGAEVTAGLLLAAVGAAGLVFMPWRMRNPWA